MPCRDIAHRCQLRHRDAASERRAIIRAVRGLDTAHFDWEVVLSTKPQDDKTSTMERDTLVKSQEITLDPKAATTHESVQETNVIPFVDIAFHPDLRRVGDCFRLPREADAANSTIGRHAPEFHGEVNAAPINDPCISRNQCQVRYREDLHEFQIEKSIDARRPIEAFNKHGVFVGEITQSPRILPPGSYIAIGDRILLRLSLRMPSPTTLGMIGISDGIAIVRRMVESVADMPGSVLVTGETGVGKELVAQAIHQKSNRAAKPFKAISCPELPETLVEAELFGHVRNAFTGAREMRLGLLRAAEDGTAFLDEVAELSLLVQAKLLRTLQEQMVRPVGSESGVQIAARFLFATHRDLADMVAKGQFRNDLYRRIEAPHVHVPPLRERSEDIPILFARFLCEHPRSVAVGLVKDVSRDSPPVPMHHVQNLLARPWPGNVRSVQRHVAQLVFQTALHGRFSAPSEEPVTPPVSLAPPAELPDEAMARRIRETLESNDYNHKRTAIALGIARSTLIRWMATFGLRSGASLEVDEIRAALASTISIREAARLLGVSERALRLRITELRMMQ